MIPKGLRKFMLTCWRCRRVLDEKKPERLVNGLCSDCRKELGE
jgi:rRNA maturation endonuclease Nob1